jgi:hypothetical protein
MSRVPAAANMCIAMANGLEDSQAVVDFRREAGPRQGFAKDADFDRRFRVRFPSQREAAMQEWSRAPVAEDLRRDQSVRAWRIPGNFRRILAAFATASRR